MKRLVDEIKNRAKGLVGSKNFPEALRLYSKAIEIVNESNESLFDKSTKAILYANRSMCFLNTGEFNSSLDDANKSIDIDQQYIKAYYRKGSKYIISMSSNNLYMSMQLWHNLD